MDTLKKIATNVGVRTDELRSRFGNRYLDSILWGAKHEVIELRNPDNLSNKVINRIKYGRATLPHDQK